jgi:hypothetical protein
MGSIRRYPINYKPKICTVESVMYYYKKIHERQVLQTKSIKADEIEIPFLFLILNDQYELPTEKMYYETIEECWGKYGPKKKSIKEYEVFIVITKIKNEHGRVNYDFDEFKN